MERKAKKHTHFHEVQNGIWERPSVEGDMEKISLWTKVLMYSRKTKSEVGLGRVLRHERKRQKGGT